MPSQLDRAARITVGGRRTGVTDDGRQHGGRPVGGRTCQEHRTQRRLVRLGRSVEDQLRDVPRVLVERRHLVLLVRPPMGGPERSRQRVGGDVVQREVRGDRAQRRDVVVGRELGQRDRRLEVLLVVDVRVPLAEAEPHPVVDPPLDQRAGVRHVVGAGRPVVGEGLVGERLTGEVLDGVEQDLVVLRPVPPLVDDPRRLRLVVPVLERQHQASHVVAGVGRQTAPVVGSVPEVDEGDHVEVGGIGERREPLRDHVELGDGQVHRFVAGRVGGEARHRPPDGVPAGGGGDLGRGRLPQVGRRPRSKPPGGRPGVPRSGPVRAARTRRRGADRYHRNRHDQGPTHRRDGIGGAHQISVDVSTPAITAAGWPTGASPGICR